MKIGAIGLVAMLKDTIRDRGYGTRFTRDLWAPRPVPGRFFSPLPVLWLLVIILTSTSLVADSEKIKTYGYFDTEVEARFKSGNKDQWEFDQHHFSLITIYTINPRYRVYSELEWEHGPSISASDVSGKIYLGNAYLEYKYTDALRLRIGKFVSPFGIYNERHDATPTFVSTKLPHSMYAAHELSPGVEGRYFARYATGLQFRGTLTNYNWRLSYQAYVSNGRGAESGGQDDNENKGLGGRLMITPPGISLNLGCSFYTDRNGLSNNARQTAFGLDLEYDLNHLHLEAEAIFADLEQLNVNDQPNGLFREPFGTYAMAAYTIKERYTPFIRWEFIHHDTGDEYEDHTDYLIGLNVSLTPQVYWKNEFHVRNVYHPDERYLMFVGSVAVAF